MISKTVLVVDTNPTTHQRVQEAFDNTGFTVLRATGAGDAQACADARSIDLVFAAVRLPGGHTGYDLARTLREQHPAALVYLLAGGFEVYDAERAAEAGVDGQIKVPFTARSLRSRVEESLGPLALGKLPAQPEPQAVAVTLALADDDDDLPPTIPAPATAPPVQPPPVSEERLATFIPRDHRYVEHVAVDPATIGPALERAILEVLPEVVEGILRNALVTSPNFRDLVAEAVAKAVAETLPEALAEKA
ncbi:MAG: response regulator [Alphaproteobacteria bacterium]|nr:response regulator [Alphaproteobacteria bacterium]